MRKVISSKDRSICLFRWSFRALMLPARRKTTNFPLPQTICSKLLQQESNHLGRQKKKVTYAEHISVLPHISLASTLSLSTFVMTLLTIVMSHPVSAENSQSSMDLGIACMKGGIHIRNLIPFTDIQICAESHCIETHVTDVELSFMFPATVCLHEHTVRIKSKRDSGTELSSVVCTPSPFCEMIDCYFCLVIINNPDCWPKTAITMIAVLSYLLLPIMCRTACLCKRASRRCFQFVLCCNFLPCKNCHQSATDTIPLVTISIRPFGFRKSSIVNIVAFLAISVLISQVHTC